MMIGRRMQGRHTQMGAMGPTHGRQKKRAPNGAFFLFLFQFYFFLKFIGAPSLSAEIF